jgi:hypothetical protein
MDATQILVGFALIAASALVLRVGKPGSDGQVRRWLRTDPQQASYAITIIMLLTLGVTQIVAGVVPG